MKVKRKKENKGLTGDECRSLITNTDDGVLRTTSHASVPDVLKEVHSTQYDNLHVNKPLLHAYSYSSSKRRSSGAETNGDTPVHGDKKEKKDDEEEIYLKRKNKNGEKEGGEKKRKDEEEEDEEKKKKKKNVVEKFHGDAYSSISTDINEGVLRNMSHGTCPNVQNELCSTYCGSTSKKHSENTASHVDHSLQRRETHGMKMKMKRKKKNNKEYTANESSSHVTNTGSGDHEELRHEMKNKRSSEKSKKESPLQRDPNGGSRKNNAELGAEMKKKQKKKYTSKPERNIDAQNQVLENIDSTGKLSISGKSLLMTQPGSCESTNILLKHKRKEKSKKLASAVVALSTHDSQLITYKNKQEMIKEKEECSLPSHVYNENYLSGSRKKEKINHPITNEKKGKSTKHKDKANKQEKDSLTSHKVCRTSMYRHRDRGHSFKETASSNIYEQKKQHSCKAETGLKNTKTCSPCRKDDGSSLYIDGNEASVANKMAIPLEKPLASTRKKLLVLDLNGLLADVVYVSQHAHQAHIRVSGKSVFKRPFCDEFLNFCFKVFDVGVWSSRRKHNVDAVVHFVMGQRKHDLIFCWDQSKCTNTGFTTVGNAHKPLVLKELKKIWNEEPGLGWDVDKYCPSNTLLIDDSPYKALCNPPHTAIFPAPYSHLNEDDNTLGCGGDLRVYLEGLAMADDVQLYVQRNPFGQPAITDSNPSWHFYVKIIEKFKNSSYPAVRN